MLEKNLSLFAGTCTTQRDKSFSRVYENVLCFPWPSLFVKVTRKQQHCIVSTFAYVWVGPASGNFPRRHRQLQPVIGVKSMLIVSPGWFTRMLADKSTPMVGGQEVAVGD